MMVGRSWAYRTLGCVVVMVIVQVTIAIFYILSPQWLVRLGSVTIHDPSGTYNMPTDTAGRMLYMAQELQESSAERREWQQPIEPQLEETYPRKWPIPTEPGQVPQEWTNLYNASGECSSCPFKEKYGIYCLQEDTRYYLQKIGNRSCLIEGTDWSFVGSAVTDGCPCKIGWQGRACSLPWSLFVSNMAIEYKQNLTVRKHPRRLIHAFPFNMEFDLFEAKLAEFGDLVDVFIILESNYTAYGEPKPLRFLNKLQQGAFENIACKVVYVFLDFFPPKAYYNGWLADHLHRNFIGTQGVGKQLRGFRNDDIFLLTDADEIPARDTILFLKIHDGYPESFGYNYQWNIYGFFWAPGGPSQFDAGVTMGMLTHVLGINKTMHVRYSSGKLYLHDVALTSYMNAGGIVSPWTFGDDQTNAGWHCSWCFSPEGIQRKLTSAVNADFPRWGDYPDKIQLPYIKRLIQKGLWFDDQSTFHQTDSTDSLYVPTYIKHHPQQFNYLLRNPYNSYLHQDYPKDMPS